jgi:hypothetical protein
MLGGGLLVVVLMLLVLVLLPMLLLLLLVVGVLHVKFVKLLVLGCGRLVLHLLADIEMLLVERLVVLLLVLS